MDEVESYTNVLEMLALAYSFPLPCCYFFGLVLIYNQPVPTIVYAMRLIKFHVFSSELLYVHEFESLSGRTDNCFRFYVFIAYEADWSFTLHATSILPGCYIFSSCIYVSTWDLTIFVQSENVIQFGLGVKSENDINRFRYVYTNWYGYLELGAM